MEDDRDSARFSKVGEASVVPCCDLLILCEIKAPAVDSRAFPRAYVG